MRVWLSYSTVCWTLQNDARGEDVVMPAEGDVFFFGCHESVIGDSPSRGRSRDDFCPGVLDRVKALYVHALEHGRAACSGDIRDFDSDEDIWHALATMTGEYDRFMHARELYYQDHPDCSRDYCYPLAAEILEDIGIDGIYRIMYS